MNDATADPRFYVVGGTVQPGRACYVPRVADAELFRRISDGDYCHVLAQRQVGKSSLAAATAAKLRARSVGVALVDLTQASAEDPAENAGRWYYSIAYRICRDLRIRADLQSWWAERGGLTNLQRLREFFQEIVLEETEEPVAVFFDRVEATIDAPLAQDLLACIRACYDARATNPEFSRLTFTLLSAAAPQDLVRNVQGSPFEIAVTVRLPDFSPQEMAALMAGLGTPPDDAEAVLTRVWSWTRGHPYLSQKVFRGLARRKDEAITAATVDALVRTQFLAPKTLLEEPHLTVIAEQLLREGPSRTARLNLYGRIRKGVEVTSDPGSAIEQQLQVAGLVYAAPGGELRVRNEIYAMVFSTRWVNQHLPYGVRGIAAAVAILAVVIALPVWYTEYLPRPYVQALSTANQDFQVAEDAYTNLVRLPGYATTAERLLESFLVRNSRQATRLGEVERINRRLAQLPGGAARAARLRAEYWERVSINKMHAGDRDAALLAALEALRVPTPERRQRVAELTGTDYAQLRSTLYAGGDVRALEADVQAGTLTVLDVQNTAAVWDLRVAAAPALLRSTELTAEEQLQLELRRYFETKWSRPRLLVALKHPQPEQIEIGLRAPSGQEVRVPLTAGRAAGNFSYAFDFARFPELKKLLGRESQGNWTLLVTDREVGGAGELLGWDIVTNGNQRLRDSASALQPIPEPRATANAEVRLGAGGRLALAWPAAAATPGPVRVWDVSRAQVIAQLPRSASFSAAEFALQGRRVLTLDAAGLTVWDTASGTAVGTLPAQVDLGMTQGLAISPNGRYVAVPDNPDATEPAIVVWDILRRREVGRVVAAVDVANVAVDSAGKRLAQSGRDARVRVWSLRDGELTHELAHSAPVRSLRFADDGQWLVTDDRTNTFRLWAMTDAVQPLLERAGNGPWEYRFASDSSALIYGSYDRPYQVIYLPTGRDGAVALRHSALAAPGEFDAGVTPVLLQRRALAVTGAAGQGIKVWELPGAAAGVASSGFRQRGARTALSQDGQRIAVGTTAGDLRVYAAAAAGAVTLVPAAADAAERPAELVTLRFGAAGALLAASTTDGLVHVWNTQTGALHSAAFEHSDGPALDLLLTADGRYLISASSLEVQVTDLGTGQNAARLRIQSTTPSLAYAEEAGQLYVAGDLGGVTRWNWRTGFAEPAVPGDIPVRKVAVSSDGTRLVTAGADRTLRHWNTETDTPLAQTIVVAGDADRLWLTQSGRQLVVLAGHWLQTVAVVPAGLTHRYTRYLSAVPVAAQPGRGGASMSVLAAAPSAGLPVLQRVDMATPAAQPVDGDPEQLLLYWRDRLGLTIGADGEITRTGLQPAALP